MRMWIASLVLLILMATVAGLGLPLAEASTVQQLDEEVPPGNPVIGDERPGDIESGKDRHYGLWALVAVCLIGAGGLLVQVERWEARRIEHTDT